MRLIQWSLLILCLTCFLGCEFSNGKQDSSSNVFSQTMQNDSEVGNLIRVSNTGGQFVLTKNGQPYFIKGAAGRSNLETLASLGGNTIRTWHEGGLDTLLDKAHSLGLMVMPGIYFGREREGFDYNDSTSIELQRKRVIQVVEQHKNHPALLAWALGNETELNASNLKLWDEINELALIIKKMDPNHPVTSVTTPMSSSLEAIADRCPDLDFLSFNIFRDLRILPDLLLNSPLQFSKPYVISEWGNRGYWEGERMDWYAPIEPSETEKIAIMKEGYETAIVNQPNNCLGSFVFYWDQKQERTHTWFSLFMENGAKTPLIDLMHDLWGSTAEIIRAPIVHNIKINGKPNKLTYVNANQTFKAEVIVELPSKQDSLTYHWEILPEGTYGGIIGGDTENRPEAVPGLITKNNLAAITFRMPPQSGAYRLFCHVYNQHGGGSAYNIPFFVSDNSLK